LKAWDLGVSLGCPHPGSGYPLNSSPLPLVGAVG